MFICTGSWRATAGHQTTDIKVSEFNFLAETFLSRRMRCLTYNLLGAVELRSGVEICDVISCAILNSHAGDHSLLGRDTVKSAQGPGSPSPYRLTVSLPSMVDSLFYPEDKSSRLFRVLMIYQNTCHVLAIFVIHSLWMPKTWVTKPEGLESSADQFRVTAVRSLKTRLLCWVGLLHDVVPSVFCAEYSSKGIVCVVRNLSLFYSFRICTVNDLWRFIECSCTIKETVIVSVGSDFSYRNSVWIKTS